ncbi:MAG TPA: phosphoglycerate dehydrogenase [Phycisphaerales bacterium]|nr:phosphoglycerate dehydrogenase [Phycisphaerales bacterium]HMP36864.1 phosphoglycerate dehydrogenase [Phycisphaerales bacterium]
MTAAPADSPSATPAGGAAISTSGQPLHAVLFEGIHPIVEELLPQAGFTVERHAHALPRERLIEVLGRADLVGIRSKSRVDSELLAAAPRLFAIGCFCIGVDQVDLRAAALRGIAVFNAPFSNTRSVAELTIAEVVALSRRLFDKSAALHGGRWDKSASGCREVRGRTLGIVGYGHIGSQVSVLAEAMGLRVLYHDISPKLPMGNARPVATLEELLASADVVSLHVPATPATRGLLGAAEIARLRPGAFVINNARGNVVDLPALAEALRAGHVGGAAIDVFPAEPEESSCPFACDLAGLPNVILTPHIGGSTEEAQEAIARDVCAKLVRFARNGSTSTAVNVPEVDLPQLRPDQHRILHFHHNVPGVLGRMHTMLATLGVNINAEHLQSSGDVSYVILDVDPVGGEAVKRGLAEVPETIRLRTLW